MRAGLIVIVELVQTFVVFRSTSIVRRSTGDLVVHRQRQIVVVPPAQRRVLIERIGIVDRRRRFLLFVLLFLQQTATQLRPSILKPNLNERSVKTME